MKQKRQALFTLEDEIDELNFKTISEETSFYINEKHVIFNNVCCKLSVGALDQVSYFAIIKVFTGKNQFSIYYITKTMYPYDYVLANGMIYEKYNSSSNQLLISELGTKWYKYENRTVITVLFFMQT